MMLKKSKPFNITIWSDDEIINPECKNLHVSIEHITENNDYMMEFDAKKIFRWVKSVI